MVSLIDGVVTVAILGGLGFVIWSKMKEKEAPLYKAIMKLKEDKKEKIKDALPQLPKTPFGEDSKIV